jgi:hypothetical protein
VTRETLDETIDRVAATLTFVPADASFSQRLRPKLGAASGVSWFAVAAATTAVAVAVVVAFTVRDQRQVPRDARLRAPLPAAAPEREVTPEPSTAMTTMPPNAAVMTIADVARDRDETPREASIPALAAPDDLAINHLTLVPLAIDPVELERIDVDAIELTEIGVADPKE